MCHHVHVFFQINPQCAFRCLFLPETLQQLGVRIGQLVDAETVDRLHALDIKNLAIRVETTIDFNNMLLALETATPNDFKQED